MSQQKAPAATHTVLVVDDDPGVRDYLSMILKKSNYNVLLADNGRTALKVVEEEKIDLVITDFVMPRGGGMELIVKLMDRNNNLTNKTSICVITGNVDLPPDFAQDAGCIACLKKPFTKEELLQVCQTALAAK